MELHKIVEESGLAWDELALRFTVFTQGVATAIVGTSSTTNLQHNVEIVNKGALSNDLVKRLREAFEKHDNNWIGQI